MLGETQHTILIIAGIFIVIFCICLLFNYVNYESQWRLPPQNCPDYWVESGNSCYNIKGLGRCTSTNIGEFSTNDVKFKDVDKNKYYYMNFDEMEGGNTTCNKQKWANRCGLTWDGINYGYGKNNPCGKL